MGKRIELDATYRIDIDEYNWILKKAVPTASTMKDGTPAKNAGKMHDITIGYFTSLKSALHAYVDCKEKDGIMEASGPVSVTKLETILTRIEERCNGLKLVEKDMEE